MDDLQLELEFPIPPYAVFEGWDHIFADGREVDCRFAIDTKTLRTLAAQRRCPMGGWESLTRAELQDLMDSVLDTNGVGGALERLPTGRPADGGDMLCAGSLLCSLPAWATADLLWDGDGRLGVPLDGPAGPGTPAISQSQEAITALLETEGCAGRARSVRRRVARGLTGSPWRDRPSAVD